jgi:hypothetical protein
MLQITLPMMPSLIYLGLCDNAWFLPSSITHLPDSQWKSLPCTPVKIQEGPVSSTIVFA